MNVYRISKSEYINDLSGTGASLYPGRWNSKGNFVLYTAQSPSLALLESVVHISELPEITYTLATIVIPDNSIYTIFEKELPPGWSNFPPDDKLKKIGDEFLKAGEFLALKIPSSIMPEENNILLNPNHAEFENVSIEKLKIINMDQRLFKLV